jgi:putative peptide zinc metalloprotease protein
VVVLVMFLPYPYQPGGPLELQPPERQQIHAETAGEVVEVYHKTGDWVAKGTVIAHLASHEQEKNAQVTRDQIAEQDAAVANARVKAQYSEREYERMKTLLASGHVSQKNFDDAEQRAESDRKTLEAARAELEKLRNQLKFFEEDIERTKLVMPIDGRIVTPYFEQKVGAYLKAGDLLAEAQNSREIYAELQVPESDIGDIDVGSKVRIKVWAYANEEFEGTVYSIRTTASESTFGRVIPVLTVIPNPNERLKTGMTGYGKVEAGTKPVAVAFTRAIVRFVVIEMWSWLP